MFRRILPFLTRPLLALVAGLLAWLPSAALADDSGVSIFGADSFTIYGDVRAVAADGEAAWSDQGFGKLRYGGNDPAHSQSLKFDPRFGEAGVIWQPKLGWSLSGTVVALAQGGGAIDGKIDAGLSEAYLSYKPLTDGKVRFSARAGLFYPPVSLEHSGPEWAVSETVTPSAIGSWIG